MQTTTWSIHHLPGRDLEAVPDRRELLALFFPWIWAAWHRCWVTLALMIVLPVAVGLASPFGALPVVYATAIIAAFEGASLRRAELALRGWHEVGTVLAATPEGAEELYLGREAA